MASLTGYIGTYWTPESRGVSRFSFDPESGALGPAELFYEARDAKCVALRGSLLAAPVQREDRAGLVLLDTARPESPFCGELCCEKKTSCYIAFGDPYLCAANYHEGLVMVYRRDERLELARRIEIAEGAGCHQALFHGRWLLVPCLELDEVRLFDIEENFAPAGSLLFPQGSGPRHGVFDRAHARLYLVTERSHELYVFRAGADGSFARESVAQILDLADPRVFRDSATAAVRLSPDERFLYVSTRGADVLSVFSLSDGKAERIQQLPCGGKHPRDMILSPDGRFVLALCRYSNDLTCFARDAESGRIGGAVSKIEVHEGSGIVLAQGGVL